MVASRHPSPEEMDAYERVLGDAMAGDPTLFAREDYVEEAWRIVDPVLKAGTPSTNIEQGTWGPGQVDRAFRRREVGIIRPRKTWKTSALPRKLPDEAVD